MPAAEQDSAFSLTEIVIALGIVSFALVAILGMFPVAVQAANDSQQETHAALIARSIFEELNSQEGNRRVITADGQFDLQSAQKTIRLDQKSAPAKVAEYDAEGALPHPLDNPGKPFLATYNASVSVDPLPASNLARVTVTVSSPTREFVFSSLLPQR